MGVVFEAWQEDLGRRVAVKLMTGADQESLLRFQREARAAASLGHPHIVQIFDFQTKPGEPPFIVMELVDGLSLKELVKSAGPLDAARAARLGVQVLSALDAAHRQGILHRDIKPANLLVSPSPTLGEAAKVLDFGIAKLTGVDAAPITQYGSVIGTLAYMSPEQARGEALDGRSDVYSLAATLFFACTGERALEASSSEAMFSALTAGQVRRLASLRPDLDPVFCAIVERALAPVREERFGGAGDMAAALKQWLGSRESACATPAPAAAWNTGGIASQPHAHGVGAGSSAPLLAPTLHQETETRTFARPPGPAWPSDGSRPADPPTRGGGRVLLGLGLLGGAAVFAVVAAAVLGVGYYYYWAPAQPVPPRSVSSAAAQTATATAPSSAPVPAGTNAAVTSTAPVAKAAKPGEPVAGSLPTVTPTVTAPAAAARPGTPATTATTTAGPTAGSALGGPCNSKADCPARMSCEGGVCTCYLHVCGGACVDTKRDATHCGDCGIRCPAGQHCLNGACTHCSVPGKFGVCGGVCTVLIDNWNHCGACGNRCKAGRPCAHGKCKE